MKKFLAILALAMPFVFSQAYAAEKKDNKMIECSKAAKGKKGDEYKAAKEACMKGEAAPAATAGDKEKKKTKLAECSHEAKGKKGAEYKAARDACMKK